MNEEQDRRLVELEVKTAFQDDLLDRLNQTIVNQQQQLDSLQAQLRYLYQSLQKTPQDSSDKPYSLFEELPPHY